MPPRRRPGACPVMDEDLDDDFDMGEGEDPDPLDAENFNPQDSAC